MSEEERQMFIFQIFNYSNNTMEMLNKKTDDELLREYDRVVLSRG